MKAARVAMAVVAALALGLGAGAIVAAGEESEGSEPPAVALASAPANPRDLGAGEQLVLVVGGVFPTRDDAERARSSMDFGELQGYYVAPISQFAGLHGILGADRSDHVLVSAFRTEQGATEFAELALAAGAPALVTPRVQNLGGFYVGLGQESDPAGKGPLTRPIPGLTIP